VSALRTKLALFAAAALLSLVVLRWLLGRSARSLESLQSFALQVLTLEHPDWELTRIEDTGIQIRDHDRSGVIYLDNVQREAGSDRARAKTLIEKSALGLSEQFQLADRGAALPELAQVKSQLRPVLLPSDYAKRYEMATAPFVADIVEGIVIDSARSTRYVRVSDLALWRVDFGTLRQLAEPALWQASQTLDLAAESPAAANQPGKFVTLATSDGYDAARLVLPEMRAALGKQLGYPFFVAVPNRDFLVAWSSDYAYADQFAAKVGEDFATRGHPISGKVFRVQASGIEAPN
jgi:hypothetical protein